MIRYEYLTSELELYHALISISTPNELITSKINELKSDKGVAIYLNKINFSLELNMHKECPICFESKLNICFNCMHFVCTDCYVKMDVCHLCRV